MQLFPCCVYYLKVHLKTQNLFLDSYISSNLSSSRQESNPGKSLKSSEGLERKTLSSCILQIILESRVSRLIYKSLECTEGSLLFDTFKYISYKASKPLSPMPRSLQPLQHSNPSFWNAAKHSCHVGPAHFFKQQ